MAKAEVDYIDAHHEMISANKIVGYSDSSEPYDQQGEIKRNRANRVIWEQHVTQLETQRDRHWMLVRITEWIAAVSMTTGFLFLIIFATVNTRS